jgi:hypothetical protein
MRNSSLTHFLPWLLVALCPPLLGHCGGAAEPGTETGNPPVVEQQKLHIVLGDTGVQVLGDAGAVTPGANVTVTNRTTGAHIAATARADGSISVVVPGSVQDEYEVTVSNGSGTQTVGLTATNGPDRGDPTGTNGTTTNGTGTNSIASDAELTSASCNTLENTLGQRVADGFSSASTACSSDSDCVYSGWGVGCYFQCGSSFLSVNGASLAQTQIERVTAPVCNELASRCAREAPQPCIGDAVSIPECADGVCRGLELGALSCNDLGNRAATRLASTIEASDHSCTTDADCTLFEPNLSCASHCNGFPSVVALSALPALNESVGQLENQFCTTFQRRSCPGPFALPCPAPLMAAKAACIFSGLGPPEGSGKCSLTSIPFGGPLAE